MPGLQRIDSSFYNLVAIATRIKLAVTEEEISVDTIYFSKRGIVIHNFKSYIYYGTVI
jgi:hypothetical protein